MYKNIFFGFTILALLLVSAWCNILQKDNDRLKRQSGELFRQVEQLKLENEKLGDNYERSKWTQTQDSHRVGQTRQQLEADLAQERKNLQDAQAKLQDLSRSNKPDGNAEIDAHIRTDKEQIQDLQARLKDLSSDTHAVDTRSSDYRRQKNQELDSLKQQNKAEREQLDESIGSLMEQLAKVRQQPKGPNRKSAIDVLNSQINDLEEQKRVLADKRKQLEAQGRSLNHQISNEVANEKTEVQGEREQVQRQLKEMQDDLQSWTAKKSASQQTQNQGGKEVQSVKNAIATSRARISALESTLSQLPK